MDRVNHRQILLITPPFTQLNTPYPATMYLKGFLNTLQISSYQVDLSLETILDLFSSKMLKSIFDSFQNKIEGLSPESLDFFYRKKYYVNCIDPVIQFLQGKNPSLAHVIIKGDYLPKGSRFYNAEDLEWAFGTMGIEDKAKYLATLFLEDIGDFITNEVDEDFGFSRYAERLARTASDFSILHDSLQTKNTVITQIIKEKVIAYLESIQPDFICITAPFPGNLFSAFYIAKVVKELKPDCICILGGGYVNTELRSLSDERVFQYFDHITLDDGELPLRTILEYYIGKVHSNDFKRTFSLKSGVVSYQNTSKEFDIPQREVGTPDYSDLKLDQYISVIEVLNPMHRKWSDGRWNKLTMAHGCYWGKCSFCDVTLDYISRYEPVSAQILCDRIETIIRQTGESGFHFVDEAAPPALMKELAIEIIKRNLQITWWTNIRFEKAFTRDLCRLLAASGCIAVTGGLEVASDRLLDKMKKGVTVSQVARVAYHFTKSNILVHSYLMYGFPTQTEQETIDSLEVVRQMMQEGIIQSGFWHLFAMTSHSPVGIAPETFSVEKTGPQFMGFADNDCFHEDPTGADHEKYSEGLKISLFNYMQGTGFETPVEDWFSFKVPKTTIQKHFIKNELDDKLDGMKYHQGLIWVGGALIPEYNPDTNEIGLLKSYARDRDEQFESTDDVLLFLYTILPKCNPNDPEYSSMTVESFLNLFTENVTKISKEDFLHSYVFYKLREFGLLIV